MPRRTANPVTNCAVALAGVVYAGISGGASSAVIAVGVSAALFSGTLGNIAGGIVAYLGGVGATDVAALFVIAFAKPLRGAFTIYGAGSANVAVNIASTLLTAALRGVARVIEADLPRLTALPVAGSISAFALVISVALFARRTIGVGEAFDAGLLLTVAKGRTGGAVGVAQTPDAGFRGDITDGGRRCAFAIVATALADAQFAGIFTGLCNDPFDKTVVVFIFAFERLVAVTLLRAPCARFRTANSLAPAYLAVGASRIVLPYRTTVNQFASSVSDRKSGRFALSLPLVIATVVEFIWTAEPLLAGLSA